jgi:hypothetical protein
LHVHPAAFARDDLADHRGREPLRPQFAGQRGRGRPRRRQQQPAGGLGVVQQDGEFGRYRGVQDREAAHALGVGPGAAGHETGRGQFGGAGQQRDRSGPEPGGHTAGGQHPVQVAEQPEPGHVGGRPHPGGQRGLARARVEQRHRGHGGIYHLGRGRATLERGRDHRGADRLGEDELVPGCRAVDGHQRGRVGQAHHGQAVLGHRVVDGVAARDEAAGLGRHLRAAAQHLAEDRDVEPVAGPGGQVDREQRPAAHRVHVGQGVRGRDPAPVTRVVDDRGEEVRGQHQRALVVKAEHGRVVAFGGADEQVAAGRAHRGDVVAHAGEQRLQLGQRQLAGAARAGRQRGQPGSPGLVSHHPGHCSRAGGRDARTSPACRAIGRRKRWLWWNECHR